MIGAFETLGDAMILRGPAVVAVARVLRHAQRAGGLEKVEHPELVRALERTTQATLAAQARRQPDTRSSCTGVEFLTAQQVADRLGVNVRTAQRLAPQLDAERRSGVWYFPADAVEAAAAERQHTEDR